MSNKFNSKNNKELLWEVLLDENFVNSLSKEDKDKLYDSFILYIKIFYEKEKNKNNSIIEMNKQFLSFFIQSINHILKDEQGPIIYKIEDIQTERQNKFAKELAEKQLDFNNMNIKFKPPTIDFTEKIEDTKIKGMDELISKTIAQRNFEISQIHNSLINYRLFLL
jgi:heme oxygenase